MLANLDHADISQSNYSFADVAPGSWYADNIAWAARNGIVIGVGQNRFAPDQIITRQEMVTILYNYAKLGGFDVYVSDGMAVGEFIGSNKISHFAIAAMSWAINEGLISGKQGDVLDPKVTVTRAEAALLFQRFCRGQA